MNLAEIQIRVYYCMVEWLRENNEEVPTRLEDFPSLKIAEESLDRMSILRTIEIDLQVAFPREKIWTCNTLGEIVQEVYCLTRREFYTDEIKR